MPDHDEPIFLPRALQHTQEQITALAAAKLWTALITTTGYEVQIVPTIPALQASRHTATVLGSDLSVCDGRYRKLGLVEPTHLKTANEWGTRPTLFWYLSSISADVGRKACVRYRQSRRT